LNGGRNMTSKDRVIAAIKHKEPDRVPTGENSIDGKLVSQILGKRTLFNGGWDELEALWGGRREEIVSDYCKDLVEVAIKLEWDYVRVPTLPKNKKYTFPKFTGSNSWEDEKGISYCFNPDAGNVITRSNYSDLSIEDLPKADDPFEVDESELEVVKYVVDKIGKTHFIIGKTPIDGTFPWEQTVGIEQFLIKMLTDPEFVFHAIDVFTSRSIKYFKAMFEIGVDAVMTTDDYCDNKGPIMGPQLFSKFILPGIRRQAEAVHALGGYFIKHTDGNLWSILDDLIETGIDGWHGIQKRIGMDLALLKKKYGSKMCFFGGVDCETLIEGTLKEVKEEVCYAIKNASKNGGLVVTNSNVIQPGSKIENYYTMREAIKEYGVY
jgi:hypothetical protein